ncbi:hypothetical protein NKW45_06425 [Acetobacter orientalis]|uniref:cell division protein FtsL n=1 Tax=Acetobacter orientalis TaxID=146474 RepID=UPI0020A41B4A|nr:hypothetical protein [Acetobacter orientalis]MCP1221481.1 hypothetical protein [Acetobacter orientalis]
MIPRPFTCCCAVLAISSGFFLYTKKHQTTLLDQQISKIVADTERVRSQTAMLRTEWALENQPERLTRLAEQHLSGLRPMEPSQFVRMADLDKHLPAISHDSVDAAHAAVALVANVTPAPHVATKPAVTTVADTRPAAPEPAHPAPRSFTTQDSQPHAATLVAEAAPAKPKLPVRAVVRHDTTLASLSNTDSLPTPRPQAVAHHAVQLASETPRAVVAVTPAPRPVPVAVANVTPALATPAPRRVAPVAVAHTTPYTPRPTITAEAETEQPVRHPLPVSVATWHAARTRHAAPTNTGYVEARANSSYGSGSLLGRGDDALPPPVPMTN